ncbi:MAG: hypothetical protein Q9195_001788 [Heterodermia aff. obscurata]
MNQITKRGITSLRHLHFRNVHLDRDHPDWDSAINSLDLWRFQHVTSLKLDFQHEETYEFRDRDDEIWVKPSVGIRGASAISDYKSRINYHVQPFMDLRILPFRQVTVTRASPIGAFQGPTEVETRFCEGLTDHLLRRRDDWVLKRRHHGFIRRGNQQHPFKRTRKLLDLKDQQVQEAFHQRLTKCDLGVDLNELASRWQDKIAHVSHSVVSPEGFHVDASSAKVDSCKIIESIELAVAEGA